MPPRIGNYSLYWNSQEVNIALQVVACFAWNIKEQ